MEDEIDLRVYLNTLIRYWRLIVALTLGAGLVALVADLLSPPMYQATAAVAIIESSSPPEDSVRFTGKAGVELATDDATLGKLLDEAGNTLPPQERSPAALRGMLKAATDTDSSIIRLSATHRDPQRAVEIANVWATVFVRQVNYSYDRSPEQIELLESQLAEAKTDLDKADQALIEFQMRSGLDVLRAQLSANQSTLSNGFGMTESLKLLLQNVHILQDQFSRQPADAPATLSDELSVLLLEANVLNTQPGVSIQLQLPSTGTAPGRTVGQQVGDLASLARLIEAKQTEIKQRADALPAEITALQGRVQQANAESARLTLDQQVAQSLYKALAQKLGETRIAALDNHGPVRLTGSATVPNRLGDGQLTRTAMAAAAGLLAGILGAFTVEYFRRPQAPPSTPPAAASSDQ